MKTTHRHIVLILSTLLLLISFGCTDDIHDQIGKAIATSGFDGGSGSYNYSIDSIGAILVTEFDTIIVNHDSTQILVSFSLPYEQDPYYSIHRVGLAISTNTRQFEVELAKAIPIVEKTSVTFSIPRVESFNNYLNIKPYAYVKYGDNLIANKLNGYSINYSNIKVRSEFISTERISQSLAVINYRIDAFANLEIIELWGMARNSNQETNAYTDTTVYESLQIDSGNSFIYTDTLRGINAGINYTLEIKGKVRFKEIFGDYVFENINCRGRYYSF